MSEASAQQEELAYLRATARLLALPLPAESEQAVRGHFARLAAFARVVGEHPLDIRDEPATLYVPGTRE